jgi:hypothetical protein
MRSNSPDGGDIILHGRFRQVNRRLPVSLTELLDGWHMVLALLCRYRLIWAELLECFLNCVAFDGKEGSDLVGHRRGLLLVRTKAEEILAAVALDPVAVIFGMLRHTGVPVGLAKDGVSASRLKSNRSVHIAKSGHNRASKILPLL